jgi:integrase
MTERGALAKVEISYVQAYRDRHGRMRHYFRRPGFKKVTLPGQPGSEEFMDAYKAALSSTKTPIGASKVKPRSMSALIMEFYKSEIYLSLRESTKRSYRNHLETFRAEHGDKSAVSIQPHHIRAILHSKASTPAQASNLRKRLRQLMQLAADLNWRTDNPVMVVRAAKRKTKGFTPWSEEDIQAYEAKWAIGTKQRLALELLVNTGVRRSDVVGMGPQHIKGGRIGVRMIKTDVLIWIPMHPSLVAAIEACPSGHLTFLVTEYQKPFSAPGFTSRFVEWAEAAGLTRRTPHGLRKSTGRRLAEAGCTEHEIASILGHQDLAEVRTYTRDVDQKRLADSAMERLKRVK